MIGTPPSKSENAAQATARSPVIPCLDPAPTGCKGYLALGRTQPRRSPYSSPAGLCSCKGQVFVAWRSLYAQNGYISRKSHWLV
ncbi:hypothetical protein WJX77_008523 [Trebouxia sp. C0004]